MSIPSPNKKRIGVWPKPTGVKAIRIPGDLYIPADVDKRPTHLMNLAAKVSLEMGIYVDTRFYIFSRKKSSGTVCAPRALYANSWLLRVRLPTYFEPLLRGGYDGSSITGPLDAAFPAEFPDETNNYDYGEDSDLEDEDESTHPDQPVGREPESSIASEDTTKEDEPVSPAPIRLGTTGQTIMMKNHAYTTWKAFIYYLYTGEIQFAPLKSQLLSAASPKPASRRQFLTPGPPPCSPKSIYRLADELGGFEELKKLALDDIKRKLSNDNILVELFSTFSCRYEAIRDMEISVACGSPRHAVKSQIRSFLAAMNTDDLRCYSDTISLLIAGLI